MMVLSCLSPCNMQIKIIYVLLYSLWRTFLYVRSDSDSAHQRRDCSNFTFVMPKMRGKAGRTSAAVWHRRITAVGKAALKCFTTRCHDNPNYTLTVSRHLAGWGDTRTAFCIIISLWLLRWTGSKVGEGKAFSCIDSSKIKKKNCWWMLYFICAITVSIQRDWV